MASWFQVPAGAKRRVASVLSASVFVMGSSFSGAAEPDEDLEAARAAVPMVLPDFEQKQPRLKTVEYVERQRHRWVWDNLTAGRLNPEGAANRFRTGYRLQLSNRRGILYEESFVAALLHTELTPASARIGGRLELQPLAILNLSMQLDYVGGFGTFNFVRGYADPTADHSDETVRESREDNRAVSGTLLTLGMLWQAKVGNIAVRNNLRAYHQDMNLAPGEVAFLNPTLDILHPNAAWALSNDTDLLYLTDFGLKLGVRYTMTDAFFSEHLGPYNEDELAVPHHRFGPAALYTFFEEPAGARYNSPTIALLTQWWLDHRYRVGQQSSAAIPYALIAFIQKGDFMP